MTLDEFKSLYAGTQYLSDFLKEVGGQEIEAIKTESCNGAEYITAWTKDKVIWADPASNYFERLPNETEIDCIEIRSIDRNP